MDHFDKVSEANKESSNVSSTGVKGQGDANVEASSTPPNNKNASDQNSPAKAQEVLNQRLLEQISGGQMQEEQSGPRQTPILPGANNTTPSMGDQAQGKFQRCIAEGDLDFVSL